MTGSAKSHSSVSESSRRHSTSIHVGSGSLSIPSISSSSISSSSKSSSSQSSSSAPAPCTCPDGLPTAYLVNFSSGGYKLYYPTVDPANIDVWNEWDAQSRTLSGGADGDIGTGDVCSGQAGDVITVTAYNPDGTVNNPHYSMEFGVLHSRTYGIFCDCCWLITGDHGVAIYYKTTGNTPIGTYVPIPLDWCGYAEFGGTGDMVSTGTVTIT